MAQQTKADDALDALDDEMVNVVPLGSTDSNTVANLYVQPEYRTGGPAMDPVEVWADHEAHGVLDVTYVGEGENTTVYQAHLPEGDA